jgi:endonuclease III
LVRSWAAGTGAPDAIRDIEDGHPDAWRKIYDGISELGLFGVAVAEEHGGAGGSVVDLCAMVDEAARALIPGPVATTALATLVVTDPALLQALSAGQLTAGATLSATLREDSGRVSGTAEHVLGALGSGLLLLPVGEHVVVVDAGADGVVVEPLEATDFSRPLARVTLDSVPATRLAVSRQEFADLAATLLAAEAAGVAKWTLDTAADYANAAPEVLAEDIRRIGLYRNKAKNIQSCCQTLVRDHGGEVPRTMEALTALDGVGRKTANVVLGNAFGINVGIVVDTHVARLSERLGLSSSATPEKIEQDLMKLFAPADWALASPKAPKDP